MDRHKSVKQDFRRAEEFRNCTISTYFIVQMVLEPALFLSGANQMLNRTRNRKRTHEQM
ncbi:hypothetical protein [Siccibacter turicensis]